jgi:hypothetical protein
VVIFTLPQAAYVSVMGALPGAPSVA